MIADGQRGDRLVHLSRERERFRSLSRCLRSSRSSPRSPIGATRGVKALQTEHGLDAGVSSLRCLHWWTQGGVRSQN